MTYRFLLLMLLILISACQATPAAEEEQQLMSIQLPMGFVADPQYAPFYVAVANGYFADAGFDVTFDYSFETDGMALVGANELPFAIVSGEQVILARAQDLPVVYVMEWYQNYPIVIVSKSSSGISTPADLAGRTIGVPGFFGATYVGYVGLLSANNLTQDDVQTEDIGFTQVEALLNDRVEAVAGYATNEPVRLRSAGESVNVIYVSDYIDMVANGIITNETTIAEHPEMVAAFVDALMHGLEDTFADPDEAFEISKQFVDGLDDSRKPVLMASLDMWQAEILGLTEPSSWEQTQSVLLESGFLDEPLSDLDQGYTNRFINEN